MISTLNSVSFVTPVPSPTCPEPQSAPDPCPAAEPCDSLATLDQRDVDALVGRILGGTYRLGRTLGSGGMGAVFEATHVRTGRPYAVKVLLPEVAVRRDALERFRREAEAVGALGHANVVAIHDFAVDDGTAYLVMERLEGEDLSARLERTERFALADALPILAQMAAGLDAAHQREIVHRDLKPANVFLARQPGASERAVLLDFGLARSLTSDTLDKLTATGVVMGTPQYMSPEQASGHPLDARADLYALATIFYEMLAGRPPFEAPTLPALFAKLATDPPTPIDHHRGDLPVGMSGVLARALAKAPQDRYPDATSLVNAVRAAAGGAIPEAQPSLETPPTVGSPIAPTPIGNHAQSWPRVDAHAPTLATPAGVLAHPAPADRSPSVTSRVSVPALQSIPRFAKRSTRPNAAWAIAVGAMVLGLFAILGTGVGIYGWYLSRVVAVQEQIVDAQRDAPRIDDDTIRRAIERAQERQPLEPLEPLDPVDPVVPLETPPTPSPVEPEPVRTPRAARRSPPVDPPSGAGAGSPPPPAPAGPRMGPAEGVPESTEFMGRRDYAGCIRETHRHPRSEALLSTRMSCASFGHDPEELRRTCDELRQHYPASSYNDVCRTLMTTQGM